MRLTWMCPTFVFDTRIPHLPVGFLHFLCSTMSLAQAGKDRQWILGGKGERTEVQKIKLHGEVIVIGERNLKTNIMEQKQLSCASHWAGVGRRARGQPWRWCPSQCSVGGEKKWLSWVSLKFVFGLCTAVCVLYHDAILWVITAYHSSIQLSMTGVKSH